MNDILWYVSEVISNIIVAIAEVHLLYKQLGVKSEKKKFVYLGTVVLIFVASLVNYINLQADVYIAPGFTIYLTRFITSILVVTFAFTVFEGSFSEKLMWGLAPMFLCTIADFISIVPMKALTNRGIETVDEYGAYRFLGTLVFTAVFVILCLALSYTNHKKEKQIKLAIPKNVQILLIIMLILGTISADILIDNSLYVLGNGGITLNLGEVVVCVTFLALVFFIFTLVTKVGVLSYENMAYVLENQKASLESDYFKNLEIAVKEIGETKHDMQNHVIAMQGYLQGKNYAGLSEYFDEMQGQLAKNIELILTDNRALNSIIYNKMLVMQANNIAFSHTLLPIGEFPISEYDFCSITGNLLDNAIEACNKLPENSESKYIELTMKHQKNMLIITISNSYNGKYTRNKSRDFVSNKPGEGHGIGLHHVGRLVQKYNGHIQFSPTSSIFVVKVFLPVAITNSLL